MKKKETTLVFHYNIFGHGESNPKLLRIILSTAYTKIDFGYIATDKYIKGGWIKIASDTFIENNESKEKFYMTKAVGITIAPEKHNFKSNKDWQYFSLYFPPLPQKDSTINIIEKANGNENDFNYYNVPLKINEGIEVIN